MHHELKRDRAPGRILVSDMGMVRKEEVNINARVIEPITLDSYQPVPPSLACRSRPCYATLQTTSIRAEQLSYLDCFKGGVYIHTHCKLVCSRPNALITIHCARAIMP